MPAREESNEALVRQFTKALNSDKQAAKEYLADEIQFNGEQISKEQWVNAHWESFVEPFADFTEPIEFTIAQGDMVGMRWRYSGVHEDGEFLGIPSTGKRIEGTGHNFYLIENDQIVEVYSEWDFNSALQALDILPKGGPSALKVRRQMLEVLLRVLRHNISNDLNTVRGFAEMIADGDVPVREYAGRIEESAESLLNTAVKAREIEQKIIHAEPTDEVDLANVVGSVKADLVQDHPEANISVSITSEKTKLVSNWELISFIILEAGKNAIIHSDNAEPKVIIEVSDSGNKDYQTIISVADSGPGIPEHELEPLYRERESSLQHGSGLGLWGMKWGIELVDGEVEFLDNEPEGSIVRFYIPDMS